MDSLLRPAGEKPTRCYCKGTCKAQSIMRGPVICFHNPPLRPGEPIPEAKDEEMFERGYN